jgi:uncharacterized protein (TIGR00730 family)
MWNSKPVVAIFGSSQIIDGDAEYEQARLLGRLLARAGFALCNGGYAGVMEATARGASEMEGASIGLTLKTFGRKSGNPFLTREIESDTLFERLSHFVELAEAFVALPGGIGTLAELFTTWNMLQIRQLAPRPFLLVGECWPAVIDHLRQNMEIRDKDLEFLQMIASPKEAVEILKAKMEQ